MPRFTFQFRGWHGIIAVVVLLGYFGVSASLPVGSTDEGTRQAVREYLLNEYSGRGPVDVHRVLAEAHAGQTVESLPEVQKFDVEFPSVSAAGKFAAEYETVRVKIAVDGGSPPTGSDLRNFRMEYTLSRKWLVVGRSDAYSYTSELLAFL